LGRIFWQLLGLVAFNDTVKSWVQRLRAFIFSKREMEDFTFYINKASIEHQTDDKILTSIILHFKIFHLLFVVIRIPKR